MRSTAAPIPLVAVLLLNVACAAEPTGLSEPPAALRPVPIADRTGGTETHRIPLTAALGTGWGAVNVTSTAEDQGTFHVQGTVHVVGAVPNTTYIVQRAPDVQNPDGICGSNWISFPTPNPGPTVTLTTSAGGAGAAHFELGVGGLFISGARFDVRFRLVDDPQSPTFELVSECVTVTVK